METSPEHQTEIIVASKTIWPIGVWYNGKQLVDWACKTLCGMAVSMSL